MKPLKFNPNLISLKWVVFLFFGALGSIFPFFTSHMGHLGLSKNEIVAIVAVAALVATLGPLIVAPLTDRLAGGTKSNSGKWLKWTIAICLLLSVLFYWLLITIPRIDRVTLIKRGPLNVSFVCDAQGGYILQDLCDNEETCYNWDSRKKGKILVKNCDFACASDAHPTWKKPNKTKPAAPRPENLSSGQFVESEANYEEGALPPIEADISVITTTTTDKPKLEIGIPPIPHICYIKTTGEAQICEVYTPSSQYVSFEFSLMPDEQRSNYSDFCKYPIADNLKCRLPEKIVDKLHKDRGSGCEPVIACELYHPYNNSDSLLERSQCGYDDLSFYLYLLIKSLGDIFPAAAFVLIDTAIVIATRETSSGRGDVGKQFAAGACGLAIFPPLISWLGPGDFRVSLVTYTVLAVVAAIILVFESKMPLSPPEWWWHTRCGLLALPMSSIRKYGFEVIALSIIFFLLGIFWSAIDIFMPWHIVQLRDPSAMIVGLSYSVAAIPAIVYLIYAEKIVDYCGHSNILILCFVNYIVHNQAMILIEDASLILVCEILEIITLHFMWVTAVLYFRYLVPRKFTTCGQAIPVIAHFCLGRCVGVILGSQAFSQDWDTFKTVHKWFAIAATVIAIIYFVSYHFYLKFYCIPPTQLPPNPAPSTVQQPNGNGSYSPLRVYHNSSSKKGQFRY